MVEHIIVNSAFILLTSIAFTIFTVSSVTNLDQIKYLINYGSAKTAGTVILNRVLNDCFANEEKYIVWNGDKYVYMERKDVGVIDISKINESKECIEGAISENSNLPVMTKVNSMPIIYVTVYDLEDKESYSITHKLNYRYMDKVGKVKNEEVNNVRSAEGAVNTYMMIASTILSIATSTITAGLIDVDLDYSVAVGGVRENELIFLDKNLNEVYYKEIPVKIVKNGEEHAGLLKFTLIYSK